MDQIIKCLLLKNGDIIISQIMEVDTELGGPDCKLVRPFKMVVSSAEYKLEYNIFPVVVILNACASKLPPRWGVVSSTTLLIILKSSKITKKKYPNIFT